MVRPPPTKKKTQPFLVPVFLTMSHCCPEKVDRPAAPELLHARSKQTKMSKIWFLTTLRSPFSVPAWCFASCMHLTGPESLFIEGFSIHDPQTLLLRSSGFDVALLCHLVAVAGLCCQFPAERQGPPGRCHYSRLSSRECLRPQGGAGRGVCRLVVSGLFCCGISHSCVVLKSNS